MSNDYTVFGYNEESGKAFVEHVTASNRFQAFYRVAESNPTLTFVASVNGTLHEDVDFNCAGEGVVDAETVLEQPDCFNTDTPDRPASTDQTAIDEDLLRALKKALNLIPNTRINDDSYRDTYALASALGKL